MLIRQEAASIHVDQRWHDEWDLPGNRYGNDYDEPNQLNAQ